MTRQPSPPVSYLAEGGTWPDGPFGPDAPVLTSATARYSTAVRAELGRRRWSVARLARETEMTAAWASQMLRGLVWPDMDAVVRIEQVLQVSFFPEDGA